MLLRDLVSLSEELFQKTSIIVFAGLTSVFLLFVAKAVPDPHRD